MAIKFSQFVVKTIQSDVDYIVGYKGADNVQITPSDFISASLGAYLPLAGGTMTGNVIFNDGVKALFGTGSDMEVFHNGSQAYIENYTGEMNFTQHLNDGDMRFKADDGSGGTATYFFLDGSDEKVNFNKNTEHQDGVKAQFGDSGDGNIYHNGSDFRIENDTGDILIQNFVDDRDIKFLCDDGGGGTATYITIDGSGTRTLFSQNIRLADDVQLNIGSSDDLRLVHSPDNSFIQNFTGDLQIQNNADDKDILFRCDDGSGGLTTYFYLDGSQTNVNFQKDAIFADSVKALFGGSGDLQIYHDGSDSYVQDTGTGDLKLQGTNLRLKNGNGTSTFLEALSGSAVSIYHNGSKKFQTTSTGIDVTGTTDTDNLTIAGAQGSSGDVLTSTGSGVAWQAGGGGGATDLNGLSDCLVDTSATSVYLANIPASLSGSPNANLVIGLNAGNAITTGGNNTLVGIASGLTGSVIEKCTYIGKSAGSGSTICADNVIIGYQSGLYNNNNNFNVYIGSDSGYLRGDRNVGIGYKSFNTFVADINDSVAIGYQAGLTATSAADDIVVIGKEAGKTVQSIGTVAIGYEAGYSHTTATGSTYLGYQAGYGVTTAWRNTLIGYQAGADASMVAGGVTAIGYQAGYEFEIGDGAVLVGRLAGGSNGSAKQETVFVGDEAGRYISSAYNTAVGARALQGGTSGGSSASYNTAIGRISMYQITTGDFNVAVGANSGAATTTADNNTLIGYEAGESITESPDNTFIGYQSGIVFNNTSGDGRNVGVGSTSAGALTTGIYNTFVGYGAGNGGGGTSATVTTGNFNTMVGYQAKGSATSAANQNSFGYNAACSGDNQITLGNTSIGTIRAQVTSITAISDERDKTDIETLPYGLDFVNSLQPRKFVWDNRAETDGDGNEFFSANKGKKDIGFIAQELQSVDDEYLNLVYDADPNKLEATYGRLIPVLVKAIQDLSAEVKELKVEVDALKAS